ncbi:MAG: HAMP domain-containing histidine kinase [Anaerolineales bacterium]|nr:HAMP domain-containing histidine kinase [Anaerolineales bacterium]
MKRSFGSVYLRFNLSHLIFWMVSILVISIFIGYALYSTSFWQTQNHLNTLADIASQLLPSDLLDYQHNAGNTELLAAHMDLVFANEPNLQWVIFSPQGDLIISSYQNTSIDTSPIFDPEFEEALTSSSGKSQKTSQNAESQTTLYQSIRIEKDGQVLGILRLAYSLYSPLQAARTSIILFFILVGSISIVVGSLSLITARNLTIPIDAITQMADQIAHGDLEARVEISKKSPEMAYLGQAFNQMAERLKVQVTELRSFVANASHELRTPLTVIKLRIEALRTGAMDEPEVANRFLAEVESEVDRLSRMVGDMLDLSRIEAGLTASQRTLVDMAGIFQDVKDTMKVRAERAGLELICHVQQGLLPVIGVEDQLRRMVYNLIDNAIKYTSRGGKVELNLCASLDPDKILLSIKDTGFGITPEQLPHIFERFFRVEATRPRYGPPQGSGLGLSIAKSIVEIHGGKIWANSAVGKGTTFFIELPVIKE